MSDLISREALQNEFAHKCRGVCDICQYDMYGLCNLIKDAPTVEAVPVVHAEWRHIGGDEWCCSECGNVISTEGSWEKPTGKFCEECGADMRKKV